LLTGYLEILLMNVVGQPGLSLLEPYRIQSLAIPADEKFLALLFAGLQWARSNAVPSRTTGKEGSFIGRLHGLSDCFASDRCNTWFRCGTSRQNDQCA